MTSRIAILMATFNGRPYLRRQLDSIAAQDHDDWYLYVSDDGSTDDTMAILHDFQREHGLGKVTLKAGPQRGFARNFMSLLLDPVIDADYFALSDQDDVWHPDKLSSAVKSLSPVPATRPTLCCGPTLWIDAADTPIGQSAAITRPPGICNALVECLAGGNTMLLNRTARDVLLRSGVTNVPWHDWWIYLAVSAVGGIVTIDPQPRLFYRQHSDNVHGVNRFWPGIARRVKAIWSGRYQEWNETNLEQLQTLRPDWTPETIQATALFRRARSARTPPGRLFNLLKSGVYRQSAAEQGALLVTALFGKI